MKRILLFAVLFFTVTLVSAQTTLFQFNFENTTVPVAPNVDNVTGTPSFTANGVGTPGYSTTNPCSGARLYTADDWDTGNNYQFTVNTTGFANMTFSFCNRTDDTAIGTFIVRVSADNGANWTTVLASYTPTTVNNTLVTGTFPIETNNATSVLIQINKTENNANNNRDYFIDNATLIGYPIPTISGFTPTIGCSNSTSVVITGTNFTGVTGVRFGGTNAASYVVNSSTQITAVPAASTTGTISVVTSEGTATSGSSFTVNATPTVSASASPSTICSGGNVPLNASVTSPTTQNTVLLYEGFNGATNSWTTFNNSSGGTPANAAWTLRPDGYSYFWGNPYPTYTFKSNDNSQFYLSNSAAQGDATTATILRSPVMSSVGYTSLSLEFYQFYLDFDGNDFARVEVSTNGTSWTTLSTTTTTQGAQNNFLRTTVNLDSYINQATLYIRFKYDAQYDWFWAIDNVTVSGNKTINYTYSWTASPSGTAGLPSGAGTASTTNNSIVVNPTLTTAYTVTATNPNTGCLNTSIINVTVNPNNTVGSPSSSPNLCIGTLMTSITHTTTGATGIGTASGLPAGVSASWASNTIIISGTPTASGTFNYSIPLDGGCGSVLNATGTITVNPLPSAPSITKVDASCTVSTGSITITAPTGMNYSINGTDYTNTDGIFTSVAAGTYQVTVRNASGCISPATQVDINPQQLKTWTGITSTDWNVGANWNPNGVPTASDCVVIPSTTTTTNNNPFVSGLVDANANTLQVDATASLTVNSLRTLTVVGKITVASSGTLTFEDKSSLVQDAATTSNSNSGEITYKRISSPMKNFDYTYWSSPVTGQNIVALSPNTLADKYFRFSGSANDWDLYNDPATSTMIPGVGYIIRVPKPNFWSNPAATTWEQLVAFKGIPNNGNYFFDAGANELNLIGNPYPSAIDADLFITNPNNANMINGALYFWTHNTAITNNEYAADDYASYTLTGGTGTGGVGNFAPEVWVDANNNLVVESGEYVDLNENGVLDKGLEWIDSNNDNIRDVGEWTDSNNNGKVDLAPVEMISNRPLGKIAAGQSFFVGTASGIPANSRFQFKNSMRIIDQNTQFFKQASTKKATAIEKNRVWLNLTNSKGAFKQLLVGYITGATNDWDNMYDGPTFDGQEFVDFYSVNKGQNLTIQGRALPFVDTDVVPLGYRSTIAGPFDISIDNRDGSLAGQAIWLEDKKTNTLHELSKGKYTFTAINGVENDRFVLKYTGKTLGTDDNEVADKSLIVSVKNKKITLTSSAEAITQVQLFDLLGRKVYDKSKINAQEWSISNLPSSEQTLIVKTTLANGAVSNKKIVY
nr:T9SS sorting signal type C domain-containing protein [uncultured Flavobacterium sp.]